MNMKEPIKYELSPKAMEVVLTLLSNAPWISVNEAINTLRSNAVPVYAPDLTDKENAEKVSDPS